MPSKTKSGSNTTKVEKKPRKDTSKLTHVVGFIYGGSTIKASTLYMFGNDTKNVEEYITNNLQWAGKCVSGRYVKCEDHEEMLTKLRELATKREVIAEPGSNILKLSVINGSALLKEATGTSQAHNIKLNSDAVETKKKEKKVVVKKTTETKDPSESKVTKKAGSSDKKQVAKAKAKSDSDSDDSDDKVSDKEHSSDDEADNGSDSDGGSDSDSDDEPEPVKPTRKNGKTKGKNKS